MAYVVPHCAGAQGDMDVDLTLAQKRADVEYLDAHILTEWSGGVQSLEGLSARDALVEGMLDSLQTSTLEWALAIHRWIRSMGDAHLRVRFDPSSPGRCAAPPPQSEVLLGVNSKLEAFGPGQGIPGSARAAWLRRTWPWVGAYVGCEATADSMQAWPEPEVGVPFQAGMAVTLEDQYTEWRIRSFGEGSDREFRRALRRSWRQIRRAKLPVLLNLCGNLGGYRSRRHAVLSAWLSAEECPMELERQWGDSAIAWSEIPMMPLVGLGGSSELPVAILLDGMSFSASLLLTDALLASGKAAVFGCAPLGKPGGCSGNPEPHVLPGSGWTVDIPKRMTKLALSVPAEYRLPDHVQCCASPPSKESALHWLQSQ